MLQTWQSTAQHATTDLYPTIQGNCAWGSRRYAVAPRHPSLVNLEAAGTEVVTQHALLDRNILGSERPYIFTMEWGVKGMFPRIMGDEPKCSPTPPPTHVMEVCSAS